MMELLAAVSTMYTAWNSKFTMSLAGKLEAGIDYWWNMKPQPGNKEERLIRHKDKYLT